MFGSGKYLMNYVWDFSVNENFIKLRPESQYVTFSSLPNKTCQ